MKVQNAGKPHATERPPEKEPMEEPLVCLGEYEGDMEYCLEAQEWLRLLERGIQ